MASVKESTSTPPEATIADGIRVYNTLSKSKEPLEPVVPGKIGIYLCGPTVYKPSHIGHMVGPVIFDTIKRYLAYCGYEVTLVINVTDVDDKLIEESTKRGISMPELAKEMTDDYMSNLAAMGVDTVDHFPRATDHMADIIGFTKDLVDKGFAYEADGDVYFEVGKDSEYGKLSHRDPDSMQGEGGEMAGRKRAAGDFALWKSAKPGEPSWDSPWGPGRPGWHIECSAMSRQILGETFDMHGGGLDLVFPHHENEIAQSECCHGKPQAKYWLHNGLMQAADEVGKVGGRKTTNKEDDAEAQAATKISKSTGASAFRDLLARFPAEVIRFCLLSSHYRRPISFSESRLDELGQSLDTFYRYFQRFTRITGDDFYELVAVDRRGEGEVQESSHETLSQVKSLRDSFLEAMDDDFNTGGAVGDLFKLVGALNRFADQANLEDPSKAGADDLTALRRGTETLRELAGVLGLFREPVATEAGGSGDDALVGKLVELMIDIRAEARKSKDFALADRVRDQLAELQIRLEDRQGGTDWSIER